MTESQVRVDNVATGMRFYSTLILGHYEYDLLSYCLEYLTMTLTVGELMHQASLSEITASLADNFALVNSCPPEVCGLLQDVRASP